MQEPIIKGFIEEIGCKGEIWTDPNKGSRHSLWEQQGEQRKSIGGPSIAALLRPAKGAVWLEQTLGGGLGRAARAECTRGSLGPPGQMAVLPGPALALGSPSCTAPRS